MNEIDDPWRNRLLDNVVELLASSLDINALIERAAHIVLPQLGDWCMVTMVKNKSFRHLALAHKDQEKEPLLRALKDAWKIDLDEPEGIARVIRTGKSIIYSNITPDQLTPGAPIRPVSAKDPEHLRLLRALGMRSIMLIPLIARGEVIGLIGFVSEKQPNGFDETQLRAAEQFARICALLIQNAELYSDLQVSEENSRRAALRAKAISSASAAFAAAELNLPLVLQEIVKQIANSIGNGCTLRLLSEEHDRLEPVAFFHSNPKGVEILKKVLLTGSHRLGEGLAGKVALTGKSNLVAVVTPEKARELLKKEHWIFLEQFPIHSMIVVPMRAQGLVIGTISLFRDESPGFYTNDDLEFLESLGNRAAMAIQNARLYAEAKRAVQVREEFLSIASHELNTPITSLLLANQNLGFIFGKIGVKNEKIGMMMRIIDSQSKQISRLVSNLLDVSRIRSGQLKLNFEFLDFSKVVQEIVERLRFELEKAKCDLRLNIEGPVTGLWDRLRIEQVINNLIGNAIKYGDGKPVEVFVGKMGENVLFKVSDHGIGINTDNQKTIFEPFERAVSSRTYGGLGLGLYIVRQIIEAHGGVITLKSNLNEGSVFSVQLPLREQKKEEVEYGIQAV